MADIVTVENLIKRFRSGETEVLAVDDLSFSVKEGELFTLLGPSGCGKTTTLRSIAGLEKITDGEISIAGKTVSGPNTFVPPEKRDIGLVFQSYALWPHMTVGQNIRYVLKAKDWPKADRERRIDEVLELIDLPDVIDRYPSELSGGQQQRIAFARAVSYEPSLLLMDEPLSNLDFKLRRQMRRNLLEILDDVGITTIYVTHDQEEAFEISDETLVMHEGQAAQRGTPQDLYQTPKTPFVAQFLGESNVFNVSANGDSVSGNRVICELSDGTVTYEMTCTYLDEEAFENPTVVFRPEDVQLSPNQSTSDNNTYEGVIRHQLYRGSFTQNIVEIGPYSLKAKTDRPLFEEGETVNVHVDPEDALLVKGYR